MLERKEKLSLGVERKELGYEGEQRVDNRRGEEMRSGSRRNAKGQVEVKSVCVCVSKRLEPV